MATETATLGGGCFWCVEAAFLRVRGVVRATSGYAGGRTEDPTYEQVCSGETGHVEVVQVEFDPSTLTYRDVLEIFFTIHDPTTPDRQGADVGTQYRSAIFTHGAEHERVARAVVEELERERVFDAPIVTEIRPLDRFWPAEAYHQRYYDRNPQVGYCRVVIAPKLAKLRAKHAEKLQPA